MSSSGTNRLLVSENAKKGGSQSALASALLNANEEAARISNSKKENKNKKK